MFHLEELREQKVANFASRIQRFLGQFTQKQFFYDLQKSANNQRMKRNPFCDCKRLLTLFFLLKKVHNKKERRRLSLTRTFTGDYMNYRENFPLKVPSKPFV